MRVENVTAIDHDLDPIDGDADDDSAFYDSAFNAEHLFPQSRGKARPGEPASAFRLLRR